MPKPMNLLVPVLAALALTAAGASAADAKPVKFRVTIKASQTTDWKQPYHETANNCYNRPWIQGEGGETVKLRGSGVAYVQKVGRRSYFTYGSPDFGAGGKPGIALKATNERRYRSAHGNKPGPCGGGSPEEVEPARCGTKKGKAFGQLSWQGSRLRLNTQFGSTTSLAFDDCDIWTPDGVTPADLTTITQRAPAREILDPDFKKHIVIARKRFSKVLYPDAAKITIATNVKWQVTLRRLG